ncbi:acyl-CoA/acyl-ACP dehydrogenase [Pseudooceanicola nitratireducens]|uniref:acyl-CoA dehydrogenase family protein n=1 Tax=Pseudooceanicola nitratireducens TaxID=517719 RepID=UPI001C9762D9|nr:acyl-CoA dehydrogenase family protein [Pseudooceanicola nitratireducens]MBY6166581.1 acyl-CoA/acyl-ACP dehydrogenase [Pseudooceanicola nitratireducens]
MPKIILDDPDQTLSMLRESVETLATRVDGAARLRRRRADGGDLDRDLWSEMAAAGWLGLLLPEDMGGSALGPAELAVLAEGLGRNLLTEPLAALAVLPGQILSAIGTPAATAIAQGLADGSRITPLLWQDARGARAPLTLAGSGDAMTLSGTAHFVTAAASATDLLVLSEKDGVPALVVLPARNGPAGSGEITVSSRPGLDGATIGQVTLSDVAVTEDQILAQGDAVETALSAAIQITRFALAAELAGVGAKALEDTVAYTRDRVQFGQSIASFQVIQHRLVDMWSDAEFACAAVTNAVEMLTEDTPDAAAQAVLAAKARAGDSAVTITRRAIHLHGAMGFTDECNIGLFNKRAITLNAMLGQSEDLRLEFLAQEMATKSTAA